MSFPLSPWTLPLVNRTYCRDVPAKRLYKVLGFFIVLDLQDIIIETPVFKHGVSPFLLFFMLLREAHLAFCLKRR